MLLRFLFGVLVLHYIDKVDILNGNRHNNIGFVTAEGFGMDSVTEQIINSLPLGAVLGSTSFEDVDDGDQDDNLVLEPNRVFYPSINSRLGVKGGLFNIHGYSEKGVDIYDIDHDGYPLNLLRTQQ